MRRQLLSIALCGPLMAADGGRISYTRDIKPIFEKRCVGCHSATATMGSLNLETWEGLQKGGNNGPVIVAKSAKESMLYLSVMGLAPAIGRMPFSNEIMPESETEAIREWIDDGAAAADVTPMKQIYSLSWRPDGKGLALGGYQEVRLMDATGSTTLGKLSGHADAVRALAYSKDGSILAAAGGVPGRRGEVKIWQADGTLQATVTGHSDCIYGLAISPDGKTIATASYDKLIKLWDASTGKEIRTLKDHTDSIYALAFTPDGKRLISAAADRTVKVWNPETGERLFTLGESTDGLNSLAVSPDGKYIAAAGADKSIRIWALEEKGATLKNSQIAHEDAILRIAWSPDSKTLVSSSADRSLKFFRASDLNELQVVGAQPDWSYAVAYAPDGKHVAVGRMNGTLMLIEVKP